MLWSFFSFGQALIVRKPLNFVLHDISPSECTASTVLTELIPLKIGGRVSA
jgi:hypothetical protein